MHGTFCRIISKAFGGSHSPHSADISGSPEGRRRSRTASLGSTSALQNLQKRLSSSSFISRRSVYQHHPGNMISTVQRSGVQAMSNNTYCECPSNMMMMVCSAGAGDGGGNNMNISGASSTTTTSLTPCITAMNINPTAPTASTLNINGGNVYAELDPVSIQQQHPHHPPLPAYPPPGEHLHPMTGIIPMPIIINPNTGAAACPLTIIGNTPGSNQYVLNHRRRQPAPLPPIPTTASVEPNNQNVLQHDPVNVINGSGGNGQITAQMNSGTPVLTKSPGGVNENISQMEMNDLNDIYYSDLDCKQIQF